MKTSKTVFQHSRFQVSTSFEVPSKFKARGIRQPGRFKVPSKFEVPHSSRFRVSQLSLLDLYLGLTCETTPWRWHVKKYVVPEIRRNRAIAKHWRHSHFRCEDPFTASFQLMPEFVPTTKHRYRQGSIRLPYSKASCASENFLLFPSAKL